MNMVERMMLLAGAELAIQAHDIINASIKRMEAMKLTYYSEMVGDIDLEIHQTKDRLASIKHVLEMRGISV